MYLVQMSVNQQERDSKTRTDHVASSEMEASSPTNSQVQGSLAAEVNWEGSWQGNMAASWHKPWSDEDSSCHHLAPQA